MPTRDRGIRRRAAALDVDLLRAAEPAADRCNHRADRRRARSTRSICGCVRRVSLGPIASSLESFDRYQRESAWTWEHMALTRARTVAGDERLRQRIAQTIECGLALAARAETARDRHRRYAPADRGRKPAPVAMGPQAPPRRLDRPRIYRAIPDAARGGGAPQVLHRAAADALRALRHGRGFGAAVAQQLSSARHCCSASTALLTLIGESGPREGALREPDAATLAHCAGAVDIARLDADITAATAQVSRWYDRLIDEPAKRSAREATEQAGESRK